MDSYTQLLMGERHGCVSWFIPSSGCGSVIIVGGRDIVICLGSQTGGREMSEWVAFWLAGPSLEIFVFGGGMYACC